MRADWRCDGCGDVPPLHVAHHNNAEVAKSVVNTMTAGSPAGRPVPLWCTWPLLRDWTVTGVAWAGDDHSGVRASVLACSGPAPLAGGPADLVIVAEEPGVGLGNRFAGLPGTDPGPELVRELTEPAPGEPTNAHAKIKVDGHPTPLWSLPAAEDRCAYVGEARGMWLYAIAWPAHAGYVLAEDVVLHDLCEWLPPELVYGAPSPYLHGLA
ncbi:hypothetical protein O7635_12510 [Asanoa sp. WMMD1127]|nr:DUF6758 family protein [Asanoa sp. WMMD1127]MDG4822673.1 hypothetical protein [Asanoa sp. WMMD1127]